MIIIDRTKRKRVNWVDSSLKSKAYKGQLKDEEYYLTLAKHNFLWRYIVTRYPKEATSPLCVLGYSAIPIAIELSQWTYPVTYITDTYEGVIKAKQDCKIQAGFFKDFYYFDFGKNCPPSCVISFIGLLDQLPLDELYDYIDLLLRRCREIVCAVPNNRDWEALFKHQYRLIMKEYPEKDWMLLCIKENE